MRLLGLIAVVAAGCAGDPPPGPCTVALNAPMAPIAIDAVVSCPQPGLLGDVAAATEERALLSIAQGRPATSQELVTVDAHGGSDRAATGAFDRSLPTHEGGLLVTDAPSLGPLYLPTGDPSVHEQLTNDTLPPWQLFGAATAGDGTIQVARSFVSHPLYLDTRAPGGGWSSATLDAAYFDGGPAALALDGGGAPYVVYWKHPPAGGGSFWLWQPPGPAVSIYGLADPSVPQLALALAVPGMGGGAPVVAFNLTDGLHLLTPSAPGFHDTLVGVPFAVTGCRGHSCFDPNPTCTAQGEGLSPGMHALARTDDGTVWQLTIQLHVDADVRLDEVPNGKSEPLCAPRVTANRSTVELQLSRAGGNVALRVPLGAIGDWGSDALDEQLGAGPLGPRNLRATAAGSKIQLALESGGVNDPFVARLLIIDTNGL